jgi:hypothetical protein
MSKKYHRDDEFDCDYRDKKRSNRKNGESRHKREIEVPVRTFEKEDRSEDRR